MASSESDGQPPRKKARGRPRLETKDETPADRRRTQIRVAQRNYRQRKEITIASLQDENQHLKRFLNQMNQSFLEFHRTAIRAGLNKFDSNLNLQLQQLTESFATWTKSATAQVSLGGDQWNGDGTESLSDNQENHVPHNLTQPQPQSMDIGWGYSATLHEAVRQNDNESFEQDAQESMDMSDFPLPIKPNAPFRRDSTGAVKMRPPVRAEQVMDQGVSWSSVDMSDFPLPIKSNSPFCRESAYAVKVRPPVRVGQVMDQAVSWSSMEMPNRERHSYGIADILSRQQYFSPASDSLIYDTNTSTRNSMTPNSTQPNSMPPFIRSPPTPPYISSLSRPLKNTWTFSYDEPTFGRRLNRSSLEQAYHLLSSAGKSPAALQWIFRLSTHKDLDELRERFDQLLRRGTDEDLDKWDSPFLHIGGAGTHYPRKSTQKNTVGQSSPWRVREMGHMIFAENLQDPSKSYSADFTGFKGEWFDAFDVEGYLRQKKGCEINGWSSEVIVYVDDENIDSEEQEAGYSDIPRNTVGLDYSYTRRISDSYSEPSSPSQGSASTSSVSTSPANDMDGSSPALDVHNIAIHTAKNNANIQYPYTDYEKFGGILVGETHELGSSFDLGNNLRPAQKRKVCFSDNENLYMENTVTEMHKLPVVKQKRTRPMWLDVDKLVAEITKRGHCIGRGPGYRRQDVDRAFQLCLSPI